MKNRALLLAVAVLVLSMLGSGVSAAEKITVAVGGWALEDTIRALEELGFTEKTGIEVEVQVRPGAAPDFLSQMTSAIMAGTTPYDVIALEDECFISMSRAGWLVPLDELFDDEFWTDFPQDMLDMIEVWHRHDGQLYRMPHNFEAQYFWYRKDILDELGLEVPQTWEELIEVGKQLTDDGVWAISDGMAKGAYLMVNLGYWTLQAGGNAFDLGPEFETALQFLHDLMYEHAIFPVAALNRDFDALNQDYMNDRVIMMRQWPYFWDVGRSDPEWFEEDKMAIALPLEGPGGRATYAAAWGWSIPKTSTKIDAAKTFIEFMTSIENAPKLAQMSVWWLSPRKSILEVVGDEGIAKYMAWYSAEGVIKPRPFHPRFLEAGTVLEDIASAYLTNQITLEETLNRARQRFDDL
ncbi:MAG TPA: extracellular solute-binding protein [Limnochordia bacterium]|jgi:ABC-type glycerol-3-phosphate transport system substrate-binding protein|nr:extracellular solute-binding protein [Limnochordia bacterium]